MEPTNEHSGDGAETAALLGAGPAPAGNPAENYQHGASLAPDVRAMLDRLERAQQSQGEALEHLRRGQLKLGNATHEELERLDQAHKELGAALTSLREGLEGVTSASVKRGEAVDAVELRVTRLEELHSKLLERVNQRGGGPVVVTPKAGTAGGGPPVAKPGLQVPGVHPESLWAEKSPEEIIAYRQRMGFQT